MRDRWYTGPLAILSSACALRPWTPSVSVAYGEQDVPGDVMTIVPTHQTVAGRWQLPGDSPWAPYQKFTILSALDSQEQEVELPDINQLEVVGQAQDVGTLVARTGMPTDAMWVLDLRGAASVAFAAALKREARESVAPVLTFNNWPAAEEVVPAEETLAALVNFHPGDTGTLPQARPVFVLDSWRLAFRFDPVDDDTTDNRYMLSPADLPAASVLRAQGVSRVIYVVESKDDSAEEEDDLNELFLEYQDAGIEVSLVDLDWFYSWAGAPPRWDERLGLCRLKVQHRQTLIQDPKFYMRAHGGFGGILSVPSVHGGWASGHGGGHGGG
jgi:hypothetical protein